jgi:glutathione S-transferase
MKLYDYAPSQNAYKARMLLQHLGISYETVPVAIFRGESHGADFLQRNPAGAVPVLEPEPGRFIAESNAILCYLAEGTRYLPAKKFERAKVLQWMFFEQDYLQPSIATLRHWRLTGKLAAHAGEVPARERGGRRVLDILERELGARAYLADAYSIADIAVFAYGHLAEDGGFDLGAYPAIRSWIERIKTDQAPLPAVVPYSVDPDSGREL